MFVLTRLNVNLKPISKPNQPSSLLRPHALVSTFVGNVRVTNCFIIIIIIYSVTPGAEPLTHRSFDITDRQLRVFDQ